MANHKKQAVLSAHYQGILFDMDSTLVEADWYSLIKKAVADSGINYSEQEYKLAWSHTITRWENWKQPNTWEPSLEYDKKIGFMWAGEIVKFLGKNEHLQLQAVDIMYEYFIDRRFFNLFNDVIPILRYLKELGFKVGIVSNWNWFLPELCKHLGISKFTDVVITSARVGFLKPHPMIFKLAAQKIHLSPETVIFAGDRIDVDIKGAISSGMTPILVNRNNQKNTYTGIQVTDLGGLKKIVQERRI